MTQQARYPERVAVVDPGFSLFGHSLYFNEHVITWLSRIFDEVYYYESFADEDVTFRSAANNVRVIPLAPALKHLAKSDPEEFYSALWERMQQDECDAVVITSEGRHGDNRALFHNPPPLPFALIVHIVWLLAARCASIDGLERGIRKARALYVLDESLAPQLAGKNKRISTFPYYTYPNEYVVPRKAPSSNLKIGTIGIINDRRNVDFLLTSLAAYRGKEFEYFLHGQPLGPVGEKVARLASQLSFPEQVALSTRFEYLTDLEYESLAVNCDFILIAYDRRRAGQAPGILFQAARANSPLIAPEIEPFISIDKRFPGIFVFYKSLSPDSLNDLIAVLAEKGKHYARIKHSTTVALQRFVNANKDKVHLRHLKAVLRPLAKVSNKAPTATALERSANDSEKPNVSVLYFPIFTDRSELFDHVARACWYLACMDVEKIYFPIAIPGEIDFRLPDYLDPAISGAYEKLQDKLVYVNCIEDDHALHELFKETRIILQWKINEFPSPLWKQRFEDERQKKQIWRVDLNNVRFEGSFYIKVGVENFPDRDGEIARNREKFNALVARMKKIQKCYVFGTGPSVSHYKEFDYSDGTSIICNSIIFDSEMMEYVNPKFLVFGDPIFHFGVSKYAATFRRRLLDTVRKHQLFLIIPFNYYRLFVYHLPELESVTVAIPIDYNLPVNFNLTESFYLNPFKNILTLLMLPLATTLANKVYLLGSDGRQKSEDSYFWKHNPRTQINDEMGNIQLVHPAFFNIDYNEYYDEHLADLEDFICEGETRGLSFSMLTPTFIPCLRQRYRYRGKSYERQFFPLVSIIIAGDMANVPRLDETVKSVTSQSYPNWELIVAAADNYASLSIPLNELAEKADRLRLVRPPEPTSLNSARYAGIRAAKGQYIAILRPGERFEAGSVALRMNTLLSEGANATFCLAKPDIDVPGLPNLRFGALTHEILGEPLAGEDLHISSLIVRRSLLLDHRLWIDDAEAGNDYPLLERIARICKRIPKAQGTTTYVNAAADAPPQGNHGKRSSENSRNFEPRIVLLSDERRKRIKRFIYGSNYNSLIASDKYYGPIGKALAAVAVHRAHRRWPELDSPKLKAIKHIHASRSRGFIICNGPSLNAVDLSYLRDEITIGVNAIYLKLPEIGFKPTYYIVEDDLVAEDRRDDINRITGTTKLFAQRLAYCLERSDETIFLNHAPDDLDPWPYQRSVLGMNMKFSEDASIATFSGFTVTYTALQIAFHTGLREVYLVGADHDYAVPESYRDRDPSENFVIESSEDDVNHFDPSYFGKGYRWHNPKLHGIENAYRNAKILFEAHGGKIFNATPRSKLEIFDRVDFNELFEPGYSNEAFHTFRREYKRHNLLPLEHSGPYFSFTGKKHLNFSLPNGKSQGYTIEFTLCSETTDFERTYSATMPPMPLIVAPLHLYQISERLMRIRLGPKFDYAFDKFANRGWYKFRLVADAINSLTALYINDVQICTKSVFVPLQRTVQMGKGIRERYWNGKLGYLCVTSRIEGGQERELLHVKPDR